MSTIVLSKGNLVQETASQSVVLSDGTVVITYVAPGGGVTGTGAITAPAATSSGSGSVTISGSGGAPGVAAVASGAGTVTVSGVGAVFGTVGVTAGAGTVTVSGSGGAIAPAANASGAYFPPITGTGAVVAPAGVCSGFFAPIFTGRCSAYVYSVGKVVEITQPSKSAILSITSKVIQL